MYHKKCKILLSAMVANESRVITRMLESCYKYVDYYIIQDNGSNDGTQEIISKFMTEKGIPGFVYETKWEYPGWNRDHLLQKCLESEHGCDWILRMDADEQLVVDDDFNWGILEDKNIQSFNITADALSSIYYRTWLWNAKLPWKFKHDKRHEVILLPGYGLDDEGFQRVNLPRSFRHIITNDGQTWDSPTKFLKDALELEADLITQGNMLKDLYHLWYLGKSYSDCYGNPDNFPFQINHSIEFARRSIFYFENYLNLHHSWDKYKTGHPENEMSYLALCLMGCAYKHMGDFDKAVEHFKSAEQFCPARNEHLMWMTETFRDIEDYESMLKCTKMLVDPNRKNPFPNKVFLLVNHAYSDTGTYVHDLHKIALSKTDKSETSKMYNQVLGPALGPSI